LWPALEGGAAGCSGLPPRAGPWLLPTAGASPWGLAVGLTTAPGIICIKGVLARWLPQTAAPIAPSTATVKSTCRQDVWRLEDCQTDALSVEACWISFRLSDILVSAEAGAGCAALRL